MIDDKKLAKIDFAIREKYKNDKKKLNGVMCLFKTNMFEIEKIKNVKDIKVKFEFSNGYQKELFEILQDNL